MLYKHNSDVFNYFLRKLPDGVICYSMFASGRYHFLSGVCFRTMHLLFDVRFRTLSFIIWCSLPDGKVVHEYQYFSIERIYNILLTTLSN